ncbi:MAG: low-density lipoprotein receptor repeat protein [Solirubrobacterales bacterium]|nr:low-density lipoprotein receptor repeat protein [Solirubrobacterales bacterium]
MPKLIAVSAFVFAILALPAPSLAATPLVVSPPSLSFEKTTVGNQTPSKEVDLYDEGEEEAQIEKIAIEGDDAAAFNLNQSNCGAISQNQHCGLWFTFMPDAAGEKHATIHIAFKNGRAEETFELSGTAVEPQLTFSPGSYDFGLQRVYEMRNTYLQLTNGGEAAVQVNNFEMLGGSGSFWSSNSDCLSHSLQPGQSCGVEVDFNPSDAIAYGAELRATANGSGFTAALSGHGGRAIVDAVPSPAGFGTATVGTQGQVRTITLTNSGNIAAGFFIGIVAGGDAGSFRLISENCSGELQPGASCTAQVHFAPLSTGAKMARLAFFGDAEAGAMVMLTGEGVAAAVRLVPAAFDFGTQAVGSKSESHAFAVRNDGGAPLELDGVTFVGADLDQFTLAGDGCSGETLAPGAECLVRARFAPDSTGAKAAKLRIVSEGGNFAALLAGTGEGAVAGDDHRQAFGYPDSPRPPQPGRQARHRRFVHGETLTAVKLRGPRRLHVRASTVPR